MHAVGNPPPSSARPSAAEIGLGPIPWLIGGEMLPEGPRATGMAIGAATNWMFTTVVALCFPLVQSALDNYSFVPFIVCIAATIAFTAVFVPETRGKTPSELMAWLNKGRGTGNSAGAGSAATAPQTTALLGSVQE